METGGSSLAPLSLRFHQFTRVQLLFGACVMCFLSSVFIFQSIIPFAVGCASFVGGCLVLHYMSKSLLGLQSLVVPTYLHFGEDLAASFKSKEGDLDIQLDAFREEIKEKVVFSWLKLITEDTEEHLNISNSFDSIFNAMVNKIACIDTGRLTSRVLNFLLAYISAVRQTGSARRTRRLKLRAAAIIGDEYEVDGYIGRYRRIGKELFNIISLHPAISNGGQESVVKEGEKERRYLRRVVADVLDAVCDKELLTCAMFKELILELSTVTFLHPLMTDLEKSDELYRLALVCLSDDEEFNRKLLKTSQTPCVTENVLNEDTETLVGDDVANSVPDEVREGYKKDGKVLLEPTARITHLYRNSPASKESHISAVFPLLKTEDLLEHSDSVQSTTELEKETVVATAAATEAATAAAAADTDTASVRFDLEDSVETTSLSEFLDCKEPSDPPSHIQRTDFMQSKSSTNGPLSSACLGMCTEETHKQIPTSDLASPASLVVSPFKKVLKRSQTAPAPSCLALHPKLSELSSSTSPSPSSSPPQQFVTPILSKHFPVYKGNRRGSADSSVFQSPRHESFISDARSEEDVAWDMGVARLPSGIKEGEHLTANNRPRSVDSEIWDVIGNRGELRYFQWPKGNKIVNQDSASDSTSIAATSEGSVDDTDDVTTVGRKRSIERYMEKSSHVQVAVGEGNLHTESEAAASAPPKRLKSHVSRIFETVNITKAEDYKVPTRDGMHEYTLYVIEFAAWYECEGLDECILESKIVRRRYREFFTLQSRLDDNVLYSKIHKGFKGPRWWSKLTIGTPSAKEIEKRRILLDKYLKSLLDHEKINNSSEMREFLAYSGDPHIAFVKRVGEFPVSIPRIDKILARTMSGMIDKVTGSLPTTSTEEKKSPELDKYMDMGKLRIGIEEGPEKTDDFVGLLASHMPKPSAANLVKPPGIPTPLELCETELSATILKIGGLLLEDRETWVLKESAWEICHHVAHPILAQILKVFLTYHLSKPRLGHYVSLIRELLTPTTQPKNSSADQVPVGSMKKCLAKIIVELLPKVVRLAVGESLLHGIVLDIYDMLDDPLVCKHLVYSILDLLLEAFKEERVQNPSSSTTPTELSNQPIRDNAASTVPSNQPIKDGITSTEPPNHPTMDNTTPTEPPNHPINGVSRKDKDI